MPRSRRSATHHATDAGKGRRGPQLAWRATTTGCGIAHCSTASPFQSFTDWTLVVCDYAPPGNVNGTRPY